MQVTLLMQKSQENARITYRFFPSHKYLVTASLNLLLIFYTTLLCAQEQLPTFDKVILFPDKLFAAIDKKAALAEEKIHDQTNKYLNKLSKVEAKLKRKLQRKDSLLAASLFGDIDKNYTLLKNISGDERDFANGYSGHLDSMSTALNFIQKNNIANISISSSIDKSLQNFKQLQTKLNASERISQQLLTRQKQLKQHFFRLGLVKEFKKYQKHVYYYQSQIKEYKRIFEDPSKIEAKLMEWIVKIPAFKSFFARYSQLGQLFPPPNHGEIGIAAIQGLQTRGSIDQLLEDKYGRSANVIQAVQNNVLSAKAQLDVVKDRVSQYNNGSFGNTGEVDMPDFTPNGQKTKSLLQRLEWGTNLQTNKKSWFFPVTSDIGWSLGYKLNDKSVIGVGGSYKIGWGNYWNDIEITHQGLGLRTFLEWQLKGSMYISGGYEQNFRSDFYHIDQLRAYSGWQKSGLIGISKKYALNKKIKGNTQLLWDFLSYQQVPQTQALMFRVCYSIK